VKKEELKKNLVEVDWPKALARLDGILKKNGTGFFVGSNVTYADLAIWYFLENGSDQGLIDVSKYENLSKFKSSIEARPNISKYRSNPNRFPVQHIFPRYVLLAYPNNFNSVKTLIAALYGGIKVEYPPFAMGKDNKTPEFLKKNPTGQVPTMDTPDGPIWESNAIVKYIARKGSDKGLYGSNDYEASQVDQWLEWYRSKVETPLAGWMMPVLGYAEFNKESHAGFKKAFAESLALFNGVLENREWLVGKRITLADITIFSYLSFAFKHVCDPEYLKPFPHVVKWANNCIAQPHVKTVITDFSFADREKAANELKRT